MGDHIEMLKAKYIETKKAVKPVTLYFNMKRMLDEANAFSQESGKQMAKQGSAGNMSKTPTPVPKKTVAAAAPAQKKVGNKENKKDQAKKETPQEPLIADIDDEDDYKKDEENYDDDFEKDPASVP